MHQFLVKDLQTGLKVYTGIPDDEGDEQVVLPSWALQLSDYLGLRDNHHISYPYDFADNWEQLLKFSDPLIALKKLETGSAGYG